MQTTVNMGLRLLNPAFNEHMEVESYGLDWKNYIPPIGSFGLPVVNCRNSRRSGNVSSLIVWSRFFTLLLSMLNPWSALIESIKAINMLAATIRIKP